jgi:hypothetical protein
MHARRHVVVGITMNRFAIFYTDENDDVYFERSFLSMEALENYIKGDEDFLKKRMKRITVIELEEPEKPDKA